MTQTELEQILRKAYQLDGWKNVAKTAMQFMRPPTAYHPSPATQTLVEKMEALKSEAITVHGEYNSGIDRAIAIARQHFAEQPTIGEDGELAVFDLICRALERTDPSVDSQANAVLAAVQPYLRMPSPDTREVKEARQRNAELVAAMMPFVKFVEFHERLKGKLDGCEPKPETGIASVMDGEDGVHLEWRDLLAVKEAFDKSQPHRPEPATPAGEL